jgi:hypothetical protein
MPYKFCKARPSPRDESKASTKNWAANSSAHLVNLQSNYFNLLD